MTYYTIVDADGQFVADRVTREELIHLRGLRSNPETGCMEPGTGVDGQPLPILVAARTRRPQLWFALTDAPEIKATLRTIRGIVHQVGRSQANATGGWQDVETSRGTFRVWTPNVQKSHKAAVRCAGERLISRVLMPLAVAA